MTSLLNIEAGLRQLALWAEDETFLTSVAPPQSIGRCADLYHDLRDVRLMADKLAAALKKIESSAQNHIIDNLSKSDDTGAAGLRYRAQITVKTRPRIAQDGWPQMHAYIQTTGRFDLLQKRLSDGAVMEMVEAGETPPGIETFDDVGVSVTKI